MITLKETEKSGIKSCKAFSLFKILKDTLYIEFLIERNRILEFVFVYNINVSVNIAKKLFGSLCVYITGIGSENMFLEMLSALPDAKDAW